MNFAKDILLIDFETTGINPEICEPLQLSAVLLDRQTLEEKQSFSSYIQADLTKALLQALVINGITKEMLVGAPTKAEVAKAFVDTFGYDVLLASWVEYLDRRMLKKTMDAAGMDVNNYDYHFFDLWPIAYAKMATQPDFNGSYKSDDLFRAFGMPQRASHDALEDCRFEAEVLRKLLKN
jgi:DNA polymerase III epsilon subunit-like protein